MAAATAGLFFLAVPAVVRAQQPPKPAPKPAPQPPARPVSKPAPKGPPKWTLEIHGGGLMGQSPTSGTSLAQFPVGDVFTTEGQIPNGGFPSRSISSWYFGDGAVLFGQVADQNTALFGGPIPRIVVLDGMLQTPAGRRQSGGTFGVRVERRLTSRFGVEVSIDRHTAPLKLSGEARSAIEAASASFAPAFTALLATAPVGGFAATSNVTVEEASTQTSVTGALTVSLVTRGRLTGYATVGGGVVSSDGGAEARLQGNYSFSIFGSFSVNETDFLTVRVAERGSSAVGVFGGGITYRTSPQQGLRVDLRLRAGKNTIRTTVDGTPSRSTGSPAAIMPSKTAPSIQFSAASGVQSTLGARIEGLETFTGSGLDTRAQVTVGYFFRF